MNSQTDTDLPPGIANSRLAQCGPLHEGLTDYIRNSSIDPDARTIAVTTLVFTYWQLAGHQLTKRVSSLLFITPDDKQCPADSFADMLLFDISATAPKLTNLWKNKDKDPADAPAEMHKWCKLYRHWVSKKNTNKASVCLKNFQYAKLAGFGDARTREFSKAWFDPYGLITKDDDYIILRLRNEEDRAALLNLTTEKDSLEQLKIPHGINPYILPTLKSIVLSGQLPAAQWSHSTMNDLLDTPRLCLHLPCPSDLKFDDTHHTLFRMYTLLWKEPGPPISAPSTLLSVPWIKHWESLIHDKLRYLSADQSFYLLEATRTLAEICCRIANFALKHTPDARATYDDIMLLGMEIYSYVLRGVTASVLGLSWHSIGFDLPCDRELSQQVLSYIRKHDAVSARDLLRHTRLSNVAERDALVSCFEQEGLVTRDGKIIRTIPYANFVRSLYERPELAPIKFASCQEKHDKA